MTIFLSTIINKIDSKGRVSVPVQFRSILQKEKSNVVVLYKSFRNNALEGCSMKRMEILSESIDSLDMYSQEQDEMSAAIFSDSCAINFDQDGRIIIPKNLLDYAEIYNKVAFVGRGSTFQVWNPDLFADYQNKMHKRLIKNKPALKLTQNTKSS